MAREPQFEIRLAVRGPYLRLLTYTIRIVLLRSGSERRGVDTGKIIFSWHSFC